VSTSSPGDQEEVPDESSVVIVVEVEERIAIVAVDTEMSAGQDFEANTGMPAEFGRADVQIAGTVECLDRATVPAWPAQQEWRNTAAAQAQEERRLDWSLGDFLVEELGRL
jgi:hypothetical protein